ncbi:unnamed protein product, partial [Effrenium voratum]
MLEDKEQAGELVHGRGTLGANLTVCEAAQRHGRLKGKRISATARMGRSLLGKISESRWSLWRLKPLAGDVQFLSFWRTLGEAARQSDVGGPATPTLPPSCRLPHLSPLSEASPGLTTPRPGPETKT